MCIYIYVYIHFCIHQNYMKVCYLFRTLFSLVQRSANCPLIALALPSKKPHSPRYILVAQDSSSFAPSLSPLMCCHRQVFYAVSPALQPISS